MKTSSSFVVGGASLADKASAFIFGQEASFGEKVHLGSLEFSEILLFHSRNHLSGQDCNFLQIFNKCVVLHLGYLWVKSYGRVNYYYLSLSEVIVKVNKNCTDVGAVCSLLFSQMK